MERMLLACHRDEIVVEQQRLLDIGLGLARQRGDAEIQLAAAQPVHQRIIEPDGHLHARRRALPDQFRERIGEDRAHERRRHTHPYHAQLAEMQVVRLLYRIMQGAAHGEDAFEEHFARGSQVHATRGPCEQLDAEFVLQPLDALGQGRLALAHLLRCTGHLPGLRHRHKIVQVLETHGIPHCYQDDAFDNACLVAGASSTRVTGRGGPAYPRSIDAAGRVFAVLRTGIRLMRVKGRLRDDPVRLSSSILDIRDRQVSQRLQHTAISPRSSLITGLCLRKLTICP
nr:hypothetical protein [Cupriavidus agavae]